MSASVTHTQTRTAEAGPLYRVLDTVTASVQLPITVFVFVTETQLFDHVATVDDIEAYPAALITAQNANLPFYRLASVQKDWVLISDAVAFAAMLHDRLKALCVDYDAALSGFVGTTTETISS